MCRLCGRVVKCIFDSMPSKTSSVASTRYYTTARSSRQAKCSSSHTSSRNLTTSALSTNRSALSCSRTFQLPQRANLQSAAIQQASTSSFAPEDTSALPPSMLSSTQQPAATTTTPVTLNTSTPSQKPLVLSKSLQQLLPALTAQKPHYITAHIHRFPYLLQTGDTLRLPFHMSGVNAGDVLRLNRASILGSRDFTLKAGTNSTETYDTKRTGEPNYLDERLFEVRARVASVDSGPMFTKEKTKRRNRKVKTAKSKHKFTVLKIMEVRIKTLDELLAEKGALLLEEA